MRSFLFPLAASLALAACGGPDQQPAPQAVPVKTITVATEDVPNVVELPGRVAAVRTAEVRARVTGIVQRRLYEEGSDVREGQPLFRIDPSEMQASYAQVEASLKSAQATATNAHAVVDRYEPLVKENAISRQEYDAAVAAMREADANVAQLRAQLQAASLQLGYTLVRAPISGRSGRAQVTEGALVSSSEGTLLATVEQTSPVYVTFNESAANLVRVRRQMAAGELDYSDGQRVEVRLTLADGSAYPVPGYIDFLAFSVEETTGTVEIRAEVPNPDGALIPGEFVRGHLRVGSRKGAIVVPQRAVTMASGGGTVMVIAEDGTAEVRSVKLGQMTEGKWIVESGLKPGDEVIISNLQKLRPGVPVQVANTPNGQDGAAAGASGATPSGAKAEEAN